MLSVINVSEKELPIVRGIALQTWPHTFKNILSPKQIDYMLDMMYSIQSLSNQVIEKNHIFLLAKDNNRYIGYVSYEINYNNSPKTKIHKIYILPTEQGKGIGKLLMNSVVDIAIRNKNISILLNVNRDNKAVFFYEKNGFVNIGTEDIDIGNGFLMEDYIMEKRLSQA